MKQLRNFFNRTSKKEDMMMRLIIRNSINVWKITISNFLLFGIIVVLLGLTPGISEAVGHKNIEKTVTRATLANGLRVIIVRNPIAPVVATVVNYKVGSNEAPNGFPGMAHAQEHMMFRGNPGLSAGQLANITSAMGGMFNADTQQSVTQYFFTVPSEYLDVALHIEAIRMGGVLDSEKLWDQERGAIEQEVAQDLSSPEYIFYTRLLAAMFKGSPYAHDALGTHASFEQTTGAMLKNFYDTWYAPNNATLIIVGDVQPEHALKLIKNRFGNIPAKKVPARPDVRLEPITPETIRLKSDLPYGLFITAFRLPGYDSPDYAASQVLADVMNSPRGDLYQLTTEGKALDTGFHLNTFSKTGLGYAVAAFPKDGQVDDVQKNLRAVLRNYVKNGFPADLVEAAKRRELASAEFQKNSVFGLSMVWSQALAVEGRRSPEDDLKAISRVSADDVNRVARRYLDLDHAVMAVLTPEASEKPSSAQSYSSKETITLPQNGTVVLPEWANRALKRLSLPPSKLNPVVKELPNGIKLIVQPESISHTVSVYGHVKNNPYLQTPHGKEGIDEVLDGLYDYGTMTLDRKAYQKALDEIAADVSAGTDFSLHVLTDHFDRGVQLLADNLLHPALPDTAFKIVRGQVKAIAAGREQSPDELTRRALKTALLPRNDPALHWATPDTVASLTPEDVRNYHSTVMRPDETVIVVIGNVTPEKAESVINKYFGIWKATGAKPNLLLPPVPPNIPSTIHVPDNSRVQDEIILAETLGLTRSDPDYYALNLGNHVLGGGFYATRLYRDLREKTGLVYHVGVDLEAGKTRSSYTVTYACDPSNVARARAIIDQNLKMMQTQPVSPSEFQRAKAMLLREIPLTESSLGSIARGFIHRSVLDLPLDEPTRAAQHYIALTAEQVRSAFARRLRTKGLVQVAEGPTPR
jgi:zinc protease